MTLSTSSYTGANTTSSNTGDTPVIRYTTTVRGRQTFGRLKSEIPDFIHIVTRKRSSIK